MDAIIRILHLEDDPADAELVRAKLEQADLACRSTRVQTKDDFEQALRQGPLDIILADYRLAICDGISALRLALGCCPEIPFIFVSGTMGEEAAIEALTRGATNYVLKNNLSRLAPAVKRALQEARNRRDGKKAEAALKASEARYIDLYDNAPDMYVSVDARSALIEKCNRTLADTLGYPKERIIGRSVFEIYHPDSLDRVKQTFEEFLQGGEIRDKELQLRKKDGSKLDVSLNVSAVRAGDGTIVSSRSTLRDITERRRNRMINAARLRLMQFAAGHTMEELLEETINEAEKVTDSLIGFYHTVDDDQQSLTLQCWSRSTKTRFCQARSKGLHFPIADSGVWADCVRQRKPVVHNNYLALPHRQGLPDGHAEVVRELVVPVLRGEKIKAILGVGNKPVDYLQKDVEAMALLADLVWEITERKQAEIRLNEQVYFLQQLIDSIPLPVYYKDREGLYLGCNTAFETFTGLPRKGIVGETVSEVIPKVHADKHHASDLALLRQPGIQTYEVNGIYQNGQPHDVIFNKATFVDADDRVAGTVGTLIDITERKAAERERLANLRFFESMDKINRAIQQADSLEQMMKDVLDVVLSIFDCERVSLLYPCDPDADVWTVPMERSKPGYAGCVYDQRLQVPMRSGTAKLLRILMAADGPVKFGPGGDHPLPANVSESYGFQSMIATALSPKVGKAWEFGLHQCSHARIWTPDEEMLVREIGRRLSDALTSLLTLRDLRKSEEFLNSVVEHIPNMIFIKDAHTRKFVRFNKAGEQLVGYPREELLDKTEHDILPQAMADLLTAMDRQALDSKNLVDIPEEAIRTRRNEERILHTKKIPILDEAGVPQYLLGISEDITERKKLEKQLRQAQKMEAVGQLAGGVAHDFNNMLGVIIGHTELALDGMNPTQPLFANLEEIRKAALHSADLTRQLLAFARKQAIAPKVLDLNDTVEGMLKMLRRLIGEEIELAWMPGSKVWPVKVDPSQVDQILANLCVNARDAIAGVGRITIETRNSAFDDGYCTDHPGFTPGEYVLLAVSDDGGGMDPKIHGKIFEPFFTTKEVGKGTGLGLATVYGIVKQNDGFINVYSEPGHGTTFKIYLPRHGAASEAALTDIPADESMLGDETILVVEDEASILGIVKEILERYGYRVMAASRPGEAINMARAHADRIHLLLTDLIMPEMNGRELARQMGAFDPQIKCLFMSGYTGNAIAHHGVLDENVHFIQKPFSKQTLALKVREVLENK